MSTAPKTQYNTFAPKYDTIEDLPCYQLEAALIQTALGSCTNLHVLDLGGGSGLHARDALAAGAAKVDVVDISPSMMDIGKSIETSLGREGKIAWHVADVSKPLTEQDLAKEIRGPEEYDIVMANWVFDHAATIEDLKGMWANVALYLKPGGLFVGIRVFEKGFKAGHMQKGNGKYGVVFSDVEEIENGVRYKVAFVATGQVVEFEATSMRDSYTLADEVPKEVGIVDLEVLKPEEMGAVKGNAEFWEEFLEAPNFVVVKGRKAS
jgi:SAM-dependent methyltransferase